MNHQSILHPGAEVSSMGRRALAKMRTRQRLLDTARHLINTRGYDAATVREIAAEADVSTGAIFASFADKADLFNQVIIADCEALIADMAALRDGGPVSDVLLAMLNRGYEVHSGRLALTKAALGFSWLRNPDHEARHRAVSRTIIALVADVLVTGVKQGELAARLDVTLVSEMLFDLYLSNFRKAIFDGWDRARLSERFRRQIEILLAGYRTPAAGLAEGAPASPAAAPI
jgi:AcrR family transcriptional regulator